MRNIIISCTVISVLPEFKLYINILINYMLRMVSALASQREVPGLNPS